jgi:uncharacterized protein involved in type VI secretion and phage assembly
LSEKDLEGLKTLREQMHITQMVVLKGTSTDNSLKIGNYRQLMDERSDLIGSTEDYGQFIITHLEHTFSREGESYTNTFEAVPAEVEVPPCNRPLETPFCEIQHAEVVENNDPDALGRIRVQFLWQRGTDQKSPWMRVASPYSGKDKGFYIVPEKGDQVVVAFEQNDPDRPYALTGLFNADTKPEHHNSDNNLKSIKTKGGNNILMSDEPGKESFGISSPKDVSISGANGKITISGQEQIMLESKGSDITIESPGTITIHAKKIVFQADAEISMEAPKINITADAEYKVASAQITIEADAMSTIKSGATLNLEGTAMTNISGGMIKLN